MILLENEIRSSLEVKISNKNEIELFLKSKNWSFTYDKYSNRYQMLIPNVNSDCTKWLIPCVITVYIYVDKNNIYSKHTIKRVYTFL